MSRRPHLTVVEAGERMHQQVLVNHLTTLHLAAFVDNYATCAQTAAQGNWSYEHYLATLTEQEIDRRTQNRRKRRIQEARFPILKELADFDFAAIPHLNQQRVLELARGRYLHDTANVLLVGAPGLGKTHFYLPIGCIQRYFARFCDACNVVYLIYPAMDGCARRAA